MNIADFLDKELEYVGVNRYANSFKTAIAQIASNKIKVEDLITQRFSFEEAPEAFRFAYGNPGQTIKVVVTND